MYNHKEDKQKNRRGRIYTDSLGNVFMMAPKFLDAKYRQSAREEITKTFTMVLPSGEKERFIVFVYPVPRKRKSLYPGKREERIHNWLLGWAEENNLLNDDKIVLPMKELKKLFNADNKGKSIPNKAFYGSFRVLAGARWLIRNDRTLETLKCNIFGPSSPEIVLDDSDLPPIYD